MLEALTYLLLNPCVLLLLLVPLVALGVRRYRRTHPPKPMTPDDPRWG